MATHHSLQRAGQGLGRSPGHAKQQSLRHPSLAALALSPSMAATYPGLWALPDQLWVHRSEPLSLPSPTPLGQKLPRPLQVLE